MFQLVESQLLVSWTVLVQSDGLNSALSPVLYGDIALSIDTQYNNNNMVWSNVDSYSNISLVSTKH